MKFASKRTRRLKLWKLLGGLAFGIALGIAVAGFAYADDVHNNNANHGNNGSHGRAAVQHPQGRAQRHGWHQTGDRDWRDHEYRARSYQSPDMIYAPPSVVYAPEPEYQSSGLSLMIPFNFGQ